MPMSALRPTFRGTSSSESAASGLTSSSRRATTRRDQRPGFSRVLYGATHRYGSAAAGSAESLRSLTGDDLRAFYAAPFNRRTRLCSSRRHTPDRAMRRSK